MDYYVGAVQSNNETLYLAYNSSPSFFYFTRAKTLAHRFITSGECLKSYNEFLDKINVKNKYKNLIIYHLVRKENEP